ncbi:MAG: GntP family permease [Telmatospirillum sp.]|nr:GntP family permease [Telmatospirillum sp.]
MDVLVVLLCLAALIFVAYRGYSVILFAPIFALAAVFVFQPIATFPAYTNLFMDKAAFFFKMYFPTFLLGAIFGKVIELSGFAKSICSALFRLVGEKHAILAIVLVTAILSYGGVSAFVLVFAIYPFASEMFRMGRIPKRLIPGVIWFGGVTFTMDAMPGSPQIQNIIPTSFFKTNAYAAPSLGIIGSLFILGLGLVYFEWQRRKAIAANEPYDSGWKLVNEPESYEHSHLPNPWIAMLPLVVVWILNYVFTQNMTAMFGKSFSLPLPGLKAPVTIDVGGMTGLWAVELALVFGILTVFLFAWRQVIPRFSAGSKSAVSGCLLAICNTASEYGYGSIIAVLPGFLMLSETLKTAIPNPLISEATSVQLLAGIVGSASGGLSIALGAMSDVYIAGANAAGIPLEVAHRIASMASGGMDSLPHNGAVITMLAITGLTHRQAYSHIFACTIIKSIAVFFAIGVYYLFGIV